MAHCRVGSCWALSEEPGAAARELERSLRPREVAQESPRCLGVCTQMMVLAVIFPAAAARAGGLGAAGWERGVGWGQSVQAQLWGRRDVGSWGSRRGPGLCGADSSGKAGALLLPPVM